MADPVTISIPKRPCFVGSCAPLKVSIDSASGIDFDDLRFTISDGHRAGLISPSRDARGGAEAPTIILLVRHEPGDWVILVTHISTGQDIAKVQFRSTDRWRGRRGRRGSGSTGRTSGNRQAAPGGGGPAGPQSVNILPATGTRRIASLFVQTASQAFPTRVSLDAIRNRWMDELINGVTHGGVTRSARAFYREVSYGHFDLLAQMFGPVALGGPWTDHFNNDSTPKGGPASKAASPPGMR